MPSIDLLFCTGLALGAIALDLPKPFQLGAELVVAQTDLPETLADLDERIDATLQLPQRTWESWSRWLGLEDEAAPEPSSTGDAPPAASPTEPHDPDCTVPTKGRKR